MTTLAHLAIATSAMALGIAMPAQAADPIKICTIDDRSGAAADNGTEVFNGLQIALAEINAAGGVGGRKIEVVSYDGKTDPQLSATYAARCAEDDKALLITGVSVTAPAAAIVPLSAEYKVPMLISTASGDTLVDNAPWAFRLGIRNSQDSAAIADLIAQQGFKRVATFVTSWTVGIEGAQAVVDQLAKKKIQVVARQVYDPAAADLSPQAGIIRDAKPDVIVNFGYPADTARALRALKQLDVKAKVISARTVILGATRKLAPDATDGVLVTNTVDPDRADVKKFIATYVAKFGPVQPTMYPVTGYDVGRIAAQAMSNPKVLQALDKNDLAGARAALRDALENIGPVKGLQGKEGTSYAIAGNNHHGSPDANWYTFLESTEKGTKLVKANLKSFVPAP